MGTLSAPLDELMEFADKIQEWLKQNLELDKMVETFVLAQGVVVAWSGIASQMFQAMIKEAVTMEMRVILQFIKAFESALNAVIDAIQAIIEALEAANPLNWF